MAKNISKSASITRVTRANSQVKATSTKIGPQMDTTRFIMHETPTPATNGVQVVFTTAFSYVAGLLEVYLDGLMQTKGVDYNETSSTSFTMTSAPDSDEVLRVNYIRQ